LISGDAAVTGAIEYVDVVFATAQHEPLAASVSKMMSGLSHALEPEVREQAERRLGRWHGAAWRGSRDTTGVRDTG
jgi:hypothetical protein